MSPPDAELSLNSIPKHPLPSNNLRLHPNPCVVGWVQAPRPALLWDMRFHIRYRGLNHLLSPCHVAVCVTYTSHQTTFSVVHFTDEETDTLEACSVAMDLVLSDSKSTGSFCISAQEKLTNLYYNCSIPLLFLLLPQVHTGPTITALSLYENKFSNLTPGLTCVVPCRCPALLSLPYCSVSHPKGLLRTMATEGQQAPSAHSH